HALVLVRQADELKGVLAMGWDPDDAREVKIDLEGGDPIARVYHSAQAAEVPAPVDLGEVVERFFAFPLSGPEPGEPPFGLILIAASSDAAELPPALLQRIGTIAPVLARVAERDELLRENRHLEQQRD